MAGVTTDVCLTFPAISAVGEGYNVCGATDAYGTVSWHVLHAFVVRMSQAGVKIADTNRVTPEILANWGSS